MGNFGGGGVKNCSACNCGSACTILCICQKPRTIHHKVNFTVWNKNIMNEDVGGIEDEMQAETDD